MQPHQALFAGAVLAGLAVVTGAFGAHWLRSELPRRGLSIDEQRRQLENWDVAVRYQMYHGLALFAIGVLGQTVHPTMLVKTAGWLFVFGTVVFSGLLYVLVLSGVKVLGAIVPIGGTALIIGWAMLAVSALSTARR